MLNKKLKPGPYLYFLLEYDTEVGVGQEGQGVIAISMCSTDSEGKPKMVFLFKVGENHKFTEYYCAPVDSDGKYVLGDGHVSMATFPVETLMGFKIISNEPVAIVMSDGLELYILKKIFERNPSYASTLLLELLNACNTTAYDICQFGLIGENTRTASPVEACETVSNFRGADRALAFSQINRMFDATPLENLDIFIFTAIRSTKPMDLLSSILVVDSKSSVIKFGLEIKWGDDVLLQDDKLKIVFNSDLNSGLNWTLLPLDMLNIFGMPPIDYYLNKCKFKSLYYSDEFTLNPIINILGSLRVDKDVLRSLNQVNVKELPKVMKLIEDLNSSGRHATHPETIPAIIKEVYKTVRV